MNILITYLNNKIEIKKIQYPFFIKLDIDIQY